MIYQKQNPIGLDALIARMQSRLYDGLTAVWNTELEAFERCYILKDEEHKKRVHRFNKKNEYELISVAEKSKFFFLHNAISKKEDSIFYKSEIELIFIVDLSILKPEILHRADLEVQNDVEMILNEFDGIWVNSLESGYERALRGIEYDQENDMQPYHAFKFNLGVSYDMSETCTC